MGRCQESAHSLQKRNRPLSLTALSLARLSAHTISSFFFKKKGERLRHAPLAAAWWLPLNGLGMMGVFHDRGLDHSPLHYTLPK